MRWKVAAVVAAMVLITGLALWVRFRPRSIAVAPPSQPSAPAASTAPKSEAQSQQQLARLLDRDGVTPERATLYFSLVFGPLPGVTIPAGIARDRDDFDGTQAAVYLMQVWQALTPEQRIAATKRMGLPAQAGIVKAVLLTGDPHFDYDAILKDADGALGALLKMPAITYAYVVDFGDAPITKDGETVKAETLSWSKFQIQTRNWIRNQANRCNIRIWDQEFAGLAELDARAILTHEMMHCYQQRAVGDFNDYSSSKRWVREGEADWAMAAVVPGGAAPVARHWNLYATHPETAFSDRGYDAIGVFGHFSDLVGSEATWPRLLQTLLLDVGGNDFTAFKYLVEGNENSFYSSWGASYFLTSGKMRWTMSGPGQPPQSGYTPGSATIDPDSSNVLDAAAWQARTVQISGSADIFIISLLTGYGRVHDQPFQIDTTLDNSGPLALCVKSGGCSCPDGSPGASVNTLRATAPISVGMEGADSGAQLLLMGKSLDNYCKEPDKPRKPADPGGGRGGAGGGGKPDPGPGPRGGFVGGDTHVTTFDGLSYDFQVVGEYTLVRSTKDDFAIQIRQVPLLKSRTVTINQAVAMKIGGKRVSITRENGQLVLRVDGAVATDAIPKLTGGSITRSVNMYGTTFLCEWPDGTTATINGGRYLDVRIAPAAERKGTLAGLLGDNDGSPANDLIGAAGASLGLQPTALDIQHALADHWRITQNASLFDYQPGQTTASFTDPTFPDPHADPSYAANAADADKRCRESGITDPDLLHNCVVDFALTSDFLFLSSYSHAQQVLAAHARIGGVTSGILKTVTLDATVTDQKSRPSLQFAANAGDVIWVGNPDCDDKAQISLFLPDGKGAPEGWACALGRFVLPATGTYTLKVPDYRKEIQTGTYHVPIRFIRADRRGTVSYGDIVKGVIETPGAHDVYMFQAHSGDVVRIAGEGCDTSGLIVGFITPNGYYDMIGPTCRSGSDVRLKDTGTYQLVINAGNGLSGQYHFVFQGASSDGVK